MEKEFLEQLEKWHEDMENERIIDAVLEIPEEQRNYDLIGLLGRAYNNNDEYHKAIETLMAVKEQGENDALWLFRLAYAYFYLKEYEHALALFEKCKEINPAEQDVDYFINLSQIQLSDAARDKTWENTVNPSVNGENSTAQEGEKSANPALYLLHLEKEIDTDFSSGRTPGFSYDVSDTAKGICYDCTFGIRDNNMADLNRRLAQKGYSADASGWKGYLRDIISSQTPALLNRLDTTGARNSLTLYVYSPEDFKDLLTFLSKAVRSLYTATPPEKQPEINYLPDMYNDDYYPDFLVDKIKTLLFGVVNFLMSGIHTYEEIQQQLDTCVIAINDLEEEFDENDSEIETVAREDICMTVQQILDAFEIDIDIETACQERDW